MKESKIGQINIRLDYQSQGDQGQNPLQKNYQQLPSGNQIRRTEILFNPQANQGNLGNGSQLNQQQFNNRKKQGNSKSNFLENNDSALIAQEIPNFHHKNYSANLMQQRDVGAFKNQSKNMLEQIQEIQQHQQNTIELTAHGSLQNTQDAPLTWTNFKDKSNKQQFLQRRGLHQIQRVAPQQEQQHQNMLQQHNPEQIQRKYSQSPNALIIGNKNKVLQIAAQHSRQMSHPLKKGYSKPQNLNNNNDSFKGENIQNGNNFRWTPEPKNFTVSKLNGGQTLYGGPSIYNNQQAMMFYNGQIKGGPKSVQGLGQKQASRVKSQLQKKDNLEQITNQISNFYSQISHNPTGQMPNTAGGVQRRIESPDVLRGQNMQLGLKENSENSYQQYLNGKTNQPSSNNRPSSAAQIYKNQQQMLNNSNITPPPLVNPQGLQGIQKMNNLSFEQSQQQHTAQFEINKKPTSKYSIPQKRQHSQTERTTAGLSTQSPVKIQHQQFVYPQLNPQFDSTHNDIPAEPQKVKISNVVTKFSFATKTGMAPHNPGKVNQDAYLTSPHLMGLRHCHFFSVCDGHGQFGKEVSNLLKHRLPFILENQMKIYFKDHDFTNYIDKDEMYNCFRESFSMANKEVYSILNDVRFSGSTCVSLITYGKKIFIANVGDSRAIIGRFINDQVVAEAITRDHKPDDKDEAAVIYQNGGRVDSYRDQNGNPLGPLRVWLKNEDIPGLAMTRSFGDAVACRVGVNAVPECDELELSVNDKFIVLASDGIWEFMKNIDVAKIIYPFYLKKNAEGAAECLVREAFKKWKKEEDVIDDITCIVIFLDVK